MGLIACGKTCGKDDVYCGKGCGKLLLKNLRTCDLGVQDYQHFSICQGGRA